LSFSLTITLFSLAGIPPLIGFFAKLMVLLSILSSGSYFVAVIIILFSVVSASYYLRLIRTIHFDSTSITDNNVNREGRINALFSHTIASLTLFLLFFIFKPTILLNSLHLLTLTIFSN